VSNEIDREALTDAQVHSMCAYVRGQECHKCASRVDTVYGHGQPGCHAIAEETLQRAASILRSTPDAGRCERDARIAELEQTVANLQSAFATYLTNEDHAALGALMNDMGRAGWGKKAKVVQKLLDAAMTNDSLSRRLKEAERDAARYRWLRSLSDANQFEVYDMAKEPLLLHTEYLDRAIDAAKGDGQ
jgi:hypothetical protein